MEPSQSADKNNRVTVKDSDPQTGTNPDDQDAQPPVQTLPIDNPLPLSPFDDGIAVVTASKTGPNKVVATGSTGAFPLATMPGVSGTYVYGGKTYTLTNGVVVSIV